MSFARSFGSRTCAVPQSSCATVTGWTQRDPAELLQITDPTSDVQRALAGISTGAQGRPIVFLGQRGRGKSHILAMLHHALESPEKVGAWAKDWGAKPGFASLIVPALPRGFIAITETLSNHEYRTASPRAWTGSNG